MAELAVEPEKPGVNSWLSVALNACFWRSGKNTFAVTILAGDLSVSPLEREDGFMLKIRHAIDAIMARGAICPILPLVVEHESRPLHSLGVAAHAATHIEALGFTQVAVVARQRVAIEILLVAGQAKTCLGAVLEWRSFPTGGRPSIWRMAGITTARGHAHVRVILIMAARAVWLCAGE